MDEAAKALLEHGVLGVVIVLQSGLIVYLLRRIEALTDRMSDLVDKAQNIAENLDYR